MTQVAARFRPYGTTIFAEMTALANKHGAVNLSQGFPDFDGPDLAKAATTRAMAAGHNQYGRMQGVPELNAALVERWKASTGLSVDGETQVTVTAGCTEALAATFLGLVNPGDEVILFEPYYDCYHAGATMAGARVRCVTMRPRRPEQPEKAGFWAEEEFLFDADELRAAFNDRTRLIVVNTPHNPTGKVYSRAELSLIAELCVKHGVIAVTDEVYERLLFEPGRPHLHLATFPGMAERTVTLSSLGKTYSLTGWKIGWAIASPDLTRAVRAAHQFLTFCAVVPVQHGAAEILRQGEHEVASLVRRLHEGRDYLGAALSKLGFRVFRPAGTYFIMVDHTDVSRRLGIDPVDDAAFCRKLTTEIGVAAIPPSGFYDRPENGKPLARFAFCKRMETLTAAIERLQKLAT